MPLKEMVSAEQKRLDREKEQVEKSAKQAQQNRDRAHRRRASKDIAQLKRLFQDDTIKLVDCSKETDKHCNAFFCQWVMFSYGDYTLTLSRQNRYGQGGLSLRMSGTNYERKSSNCDGVWWDSYYIPTKHFLIDLAEKTAFDLSSVKKVDLKALAAEIAVAQKSEDANNPYRNIR